MEASEIVPDLDILANAYNLFRFSEPPGGRPPDVVVTLIYASSIQPDLECSSDVLDVGDAVNED